MSAMTAAEYSRTTARGRPSWAVLVVSVLILVLTALLVASGLLVRLANDHEGQAILPPSVGAGQSISGELRRSNQGLLPVEAWLQPRTGSSLQYTDLPPGLAATVQRVDDKTYLYQGPLTQSMGPLAVIQPGQSLALKLTVTSVDAHGTAQVPVNFTYYWAARPALPWWWWIPPALLILAILAYGIRRSRGGREG